MSTNLYFITFSIITLLLNISECNSRNIFEEIAKKFGDEVVKYIINPATDFEHVHRPDPAHRINTDDLIKGEGYVAERHEITTEDRYILLVNRIPRGKNQLPSIDRQPVILQHGLLFSSAAWVLNGAANSLAFLLADEGYDVWIPNARGNTYSRRHEFLDPDRNSERFFNYSFHEMGYYDMPAIIDYVLNSTGYSQVFYIGHSMGSTMSYVLPAMRPEYNDKIKVIFSMAPIAFLGDLKTPFRLIRNILLDKIGNYSNFYENYEILPKNEWTDRIDKYICTDNSEFSYLCDMLLAPFGRTDYDHSDLSIMHKLFQHFPAGSSLKTFLHYNQFQKENRFNRFNYGWYENYLHYKTIIAPDYDLQKVTAPIVMFFGKGDVLSIKQDVDVLFNKLPHIVGKIIVRYDKFDHFDFLIAKNVKPLLYDTVIDILNRYRDGGYVDKEFLTKYGAE